MRKEYIRQIKPVKLKIADKFKKPSPKYKLKIWPKNYQRFSTSGEGENFYVKPQKHNYKLLIISIILVFLLWLIFLRPVDSRKKRHDTYDKSIKVMILEPLEESQP